MRSNQIRGRSLKKLVGESKGSDFFNISQFLTGGVLVMIGFGLGILISLNSTFALATATDADVSNGRATPPNATDSNATASNATSSNATPPNATSTNASQTDNVMYLNRLEFSTMSAKPGEKVYVVKETIGACNSAMSIALMNKETGSIFSVNVSDLTENPYFIVPKNALGGEFVVHSVFLVGLNSDNTTFTKEYEKMAMFQELTLNIVVEVPKVITLNRLSLSNSSVKVGEKVFMNYQATEKLVALKLEFKSSQGSEFNCYVNDLEGKPYFVVPSFVLEGNYALEQVSLVSAEATMVLTNGSNYQFDVSLEVKTNQEETFHYNNSDITEVILEKIYTGADEIEVTIDATDDSIISSEVFQAIKGTKKKLVIQYQDYQMIFYGNDVEMLKSIDVRATTDIISQDSELGSVLDSGIVIRFASNGNLPGKALIRVKIDDEMKKVLGTGKIYVYYYDEDEQKFEIVAREVVARDGYYEFSVDHHSEYVLVKNELDETLMLKEDSNIVNFRQSNTTYLLMVMGCILLIVVVLVIIGLKKENRKS